MNKDKHNEPSPEMQETLNTFVAKLESGVLPWRPGFRGGGGGLPLRVTGESYNGTDVIFL
jgi:antirestriction protein ArdC